MSQHSRYTEAVPLSLSSMAHLTLPLTKGVLDGLAQVLQHTLQCCVNYCRFTYNPHDWTFRHLKTSQFAWTAVKGEAAPRDLPLALSKEGFKHQYARHAFLYFSPSEQQPQNLTLQQELSFVKEWTKQPTILGRVSLLYTTKELLTEAELQGLEEEDDDDEEDDTPTAVLYKVVVEYRSLPATGNKQAVQAEELSMLSFGGSVDDDVKYGALASLYDKNAKYALEIYSVRGKKYKFDLMDATLSDGTVPRLPSNHDETTDPFVKSLCVTVTDHKAVPSTAEENGKDDSDSKEDNQEDASGGEEKKLAAAPKYSVTRMHLTLEGPLRTSLEEIPSIHYMASHIQDMFLTFQPNPSAQAISHPSGHTLLLDPREAGRIYMNGRYATTWGKDPKIGSHTPALFGMDLHSVPYWHGRIFDYHVLKVAYANLLQEVLIDAKHLHLNVGTKLLYRLMTGKDPLSERKNTKSTKRKQPGDNSGNEGSDSSDDEDDEDEEELTSHECLESEVMQSTVFDPVGISAKALGTRFKEEFGEDGIPCLVHERLWVLEMLPGSTPIVVPPRLLSVLRRGGYFNIQRASDEIFFTQPVKVQEGEDEKTALVKAAIELLKQSGCADVEPKHVKFFEGRGIREPVKYKGLIRYDRTARQYHIHQDFLALPLERSDGKVHTSERAYVLGYYIAAEHPDGSTLIRYLTKLKQQ